MPASARVFRQANGPTGPEARVGNRPSQEVAAVGRHFEAKGASRTPLGDASASLASGPLQPIDSLRVSAPEHRGPEAQLARPHGREWFTSQDKRGFGH